MYGRSSVGRTEHEGPRFHSWPMWMSAKTAITIFLKGAGDELLKEKKWKRVNNFRIIYYSFGVISRQAADRLRREYFIKYKF